jgi:glycosyltransferase involved in cell wall biosynthesis
MSARTIAHVIARLDLGGAGRALIGLARYSAQTGRFRHFLLSLLPPAPRARALAAAAGIEITDGGDRRIATDTLAQADIVQLHFWNSPELYEFLERELPPARLLVWLHVSGAAPPQIVTREIAGLADQLVATSAPTLARIAAAGGEAPPSAVVAGGADFARFAALQRAPRQGFRVGYVGTVDFCKMHPDFVALHAAIDVPGLRVVACGAGGAHRALARAAAARGLADRFEFRGHVDDVGAVLAALDVFGYPLCEPNWATSDLALQEAMYAGVPPVVLPHGDAAQMVRHGETGLVASPGDYAAAIAHLHRRPDERARLGRNAAAHARERFGAANAARAMNEAYAALLERPKRARPPLPPIGGSAGGAGTKAPGAGRFVRALGGTAPEFAASLAATAPEEARAADARIARASPALASGGAGGVLHYRARYPDDAYLRLWSGLVLLQAGRPALAAAELERAVALGCPAWRAQAHLARAARESRAAAAPPHAGAPSP